MKYFQVLKQFDGLQAWHWSDRVRALVLDREFIAGELLTEVEFRKINAGVYRIYGRGWVRDGVQLFRVVDIPKTKIYWSFGARFPYHDTPERAEVV